MARSDRYWELIGHSNRIPFAEAARRALENEASHPLHGLPAAAEDLVKRIHPARPVRNIQ